MRITFLSFILFIVIHALPCNMNRQVDDKFESHRAVQFGSVRIGSVLFCCVFMGTPDTCMRITWFNTIRFNAIKRLAILHAVVLIRIGTERESERECVSESLLAFHCIWLPCSCLTKIFTSNECYTRAQMLLFSDKYRTTTIRLFELSNAYVRYEFLYNIDWCEFVNVKYWNGELRFPINKAENADILLSFSSTGFVVFAFSRLLKF